MSSILDAEWQEHLADAREIVKISMNNNGKISIESLINNIASSLRESVCKHCGTLVKEASTIDNDPRIDREHFTINGKRLRPGTFRLFIHMYLHPGPVTAQSLARDELISERVARIEHSARNMMYELRRDLKDTDFSITNRNRGWDMLGIYELIDISKI